MALPSQVIYLTHNSADPTTYDAKFSDGTVLATGLVDAGSNFFKNVMGALQAYPGAEETDQVNIISVSSNPFYNGRVGVPLD